VREARRLYAENGQRDAAVEGAGLRAERRSRDHEAARRVADLLAELGDRAESAPLSPERRPSPAETSEPLRVDADVPLDGRPPIPLGLEIEHTSYADSTETYPDASTLSLDGAVGADAFGSGSAGAAGYPEMVANAGRAASEGMSSARAG
jgi:hypothetical protein